MPIPMIFQAINCLVSGADSVFFRTSCSCCGLRQHACHAGAAPWLQRFWENMAVCQNLVPLVNLKIAGKWMFISLKMVLIGIDPYPYDYSSWGLPSGQRANITMERSTIL